MIAARSVTIQRSGRSLLHQIDLELPPASFTAIIGPNGAGKSTLLKALTGELRLTRGIVTYHGDNIADLDARTLAQQRAVLPQSLELSFPFSVLEIVRMGAVARGATAPEADARKALMKVGLAGFEGRSYSTLSGGEQQRVHLARALAQVPNPISNGKPEALFLDEPTASLDLRHQISVLELAKQFSNDGGILLAILHDLNLAAEFADQIIVLDEGHIRARGAPCSTLTDAVLAQVYGISGIVGRIPRGEVPFILPQARHS
ncbi:heme ABC transporter ATP-binding protein [Rhizobium helianthi]|uniref:Heme ABC transporter ATP-binding protein n=1 Tax=Rhizobium helianthi TaxID=1132695 RepID=A0ABW4M1X0_9HYPH